MNGRNSSFCFVGSAGPSSSSAKEDTISERCKRGARTAVDFPCRVDFWRKESEEQIEVVNAECVGDNVESLNVHNAAHVQESEHDGADPSHRRVWCGQVEKSLVLLQERHRIINQQLIRQHTCPARVKKRDTADGGVRMSSSTPSMSILQPSK